MTVTHIFYYKQKSLSDSVIVAKEYVGELGKDMWEGLRALDKFKAL